MEIFKLNPHSLKELEMSKLSLQSLKEPEISKFGGEVMSDSRLGPNGAWSDSPVLISIGGSFALAMTSSNSEGVFIFFIARF